MTEGWLVLTWDTLCLYDRDPRGVTRKPIYKLFLKEPGVVYMILPTVTRRNLPHSTSASLMKAFGIQINSSKQSKELYFMASSLQSKIEWVEMIQKVLSEPMSKDGHISSPSNFVSPKGGRELKAVSIVPLATTPLKGSDLDGGRQSAMSMHNVSNESGMDFSIRSSMLDGSSSSDSSYI